MISVLIPTKNEKDNLPGCLQSVAWCDDIHVYDSGSSDATPDIARAANANFSLAPSSSSPIMFGGNEAEHRNWALGHLPFKYNWILLVDADERVTPELHRQALAAASSPNHNVAFLIERRDFLLGQWLRHVQATSHYIRLFRRDKMSYQRLINPVSVPAGPVGKIDGYLDHHPFNRGMSHWLTRHNSYSTLEAQQIITNRAQQSTFSLKKAFISADPTERRFHQKEFFYRLPARPLIKFLLLYLAKRGFLDGRAGLTYAILQSIYEYMIVLKTRELTTASIQAIPQPKVAAAKNSHA